MDREVISEIVLSPTLTDAEALFSLVSLHEEQALKFMNFLISSLREFDSVS